MSKHGVFSGPYFAVSVFSPNTGKYGPGKTPYLDTFHTGKDFRFRPKLENSVLKLNAMIKI